MQPFRRLTSVAMTLMDDNIDTDVLFPARFLLIMERSGLGPYLLYDKRFDAAGAVRPESPLDRPEFRGAAILIAGANFGCGSSREQAVWALHGFGVRAVIAAGFGEIFHSNCFKSGVLPIVLPAATVAALAGQAAQGAIFDIDLDAQRIAVDGADISFQVDPGRREALLRGWDEIDVILHEELSNIDRFESGHRLAQPWLFA